MRPRQRFGLVLEIGGLLAILFAVWGLIDIGSCGGDLEPACPAEAAPYFVAMFGGIPALVIGGIMSGQLAAMPLALPGFGIMLVAKAYVDREPGERTVLLIVGGSLLALTAVGIGALRRSLGKQRKAMELTQTGLKARGRIVNIRDTGMLINDNPRVEITFDIDPLDGSDNWRGSKTMTVSQVHMPREGDVWPVWYDPVAPQENWAVGMPSGETEVPDHVWKEFGITPPGGDAETDNRLDALERLGRLREEGVLSEREFEAEKARILGTTDGF